MFPDFRHPPKRIYPLRPPPGTPGGAPPGGRAPPSPAPPPEAGIPDRNAPRWQRRCRTRRPRAGSCFWSCSWSCPGSCSCSCSWLGRGRGGPRELWTTRGPRGEEKGSTGAAGPWGGGWMPTNAGAAADQEREFGPPTSGNRGRPARLRAGPPVAWRASPGWVNARRPPRGGRPPLLRVDATLVPIIPGLPPLRKPLEGLAGRGLAGREGGGPPGARRAGDGRAAGCGRRRRGHRHRVPRGGRGPGAGAGGRDRSGGRGRTRRGGPRREGGAGGRGPGGQLRGVALGPRPPDFGYAAGRRAAHSAQRGS